MKKKKNFNNLTSVQTLQLHLVEMNKILGIF